MDTTATLDFRDALTGAQDRQALLDCLGTRLKTFGVGRFGYGFFTMRTSRGLMSDLHDLRFHHSFPSEWEDISDSKEPLAEDPTVALLLTGQAEVDWTAAGEVAGRIGPKAERFHAAELDIGMRYGVSLRGAEDCKGRILSALCMWFEDRSDEATYRSDWARFGDEIRRTVQLFDTLARDDNATKMIGLTRRERDALCFLATGDRSAEASWKMGISEKTFEKHVASAKDKLAANTRDHAIAKALVMGLIEP